MLLIDCIFIGWFVFVGGVFGGKLFFVFYDLVSIFLWWVWVVDGKMIIIVLMGVYLCVEFMKFVLGVCIKIGDGYVILLLLVFVVG